MTARKFSGSKGQGALEYLLLIGGAVLIAAVAITLLAGSGASGTNTTRTSRSTYSTSYDDLSALAGQYNCYSFNKPETFQIYLINAGDSPSENTDHAALTADINGLLTTGALAGVLSNKNINPVVTEINSASDLNKFLFEAQEKSIFINTHGGVTPIPSTYVIFPPSPGDASWNVWFDVIADRVDKGKYIWVSTAGWPFYYVGNTNVGWAYPSLSPGMLGIGEVGAQEFLDDYPDAYAIDEASIMFAPSGIEHMSKITAAGRAFSDCWSMSVPEIINTTWPVPANANPKSNRAFYTDVGNNGQSVEYVKMGNGYFVHSGISPYDSNSENPYAQEQVNVLVALQLASLMHQ